MAQEDSGLVKRGLGLLLLMSVLVVVLLMVLFNRNLPAAPTGAARPEEHALALVSVAAVFPASVSWAGVFQIGAVMPSAPGWEVRYNAAQVLARRGSLKTPWPVVREMLDESQQLRNFRARLKDGRDVADEAAARGALLTALGAVAEWHRKNAGNKEAVSLSEPLLEVYAAVDRLAQNPIVEVKSQAENTRQLLFR